MKHMRTKQDLFKLLDELAHVHITAADDDRLIALSGRLQRVVLSFDVLRRFKEFRSSLYSRFAAYQGQIANELKSRGIILLDLRRVAAETPEVVEEEAAGYGFEKLSETVEYFAEMTKFDGSYRPLLVLFANEVEKRCSIKSRPLVN